MFGGGKKYCGKKTVGFKPTWNTHGLKTGLYDRKPRLPTEPSLSLLCKTKLFIYIYIYTHTHTHTHTEYLRRERKNV